MARRDARSSFLCLAGVWLAVACGPPGHAGGPGQAKGTPELPGVDTSDLTGQERRLWSEAVEGLSAPCANVQSSLAQCVREQRICSACIPAARVVAAQVRKGKTLAQVREAYRVRFSPDLVREIDLGSSASRGPKNARVVIVEWADFKCVFCSDASSVLGSLQRAHPNDVRLVFKQFPLSSHRNSEFAARASVAAHQQGKFWELHERLFASQRLGLDEAQVLQLAREAGLDVSRLRQDLDHETTRKSIAEDREQALRLGLKGTPMIFINGRLFDQNHFDLKEDVAEWVSTELEISAGNPRTRTPQEIRP